MIPDLPAFYNRLAFLCLVAFAFGLAWGALLALRF